MSPWRIREAARALSAGGVIAYPTETVFGLGCDPLHWPAVERILTLKQRPIRKGLILIGGCLEHLRPYIDVHDQSDLERLNATPECPTTWVVPANPDTPKWLTGEHNSIAVRVSRHPLAAALCNSFGGAIVSTSANPGGLSPARSSLKVRCYFGNRLDHVLAGTTPQDVAPSTIKRLGDDAVLRGR